MKPELKCMLSYAEMTMDGVGTARWFVFQFSIIRPQLDNVITPMMQLYKHNNRHKLYPS